MTKLVNEFDGVGMFFELETMELHCGFTRDLLEKEQAGFNERIEKKIEELRGVGREELLESEQDDYFYLFDIFPSIQWLSLFIASYSIFEKNINYICFLVKVKTGADFKVNDLKGKGVERAKLYLKKSAKIESPFTTDLWGKIKKYAGLRNALAHATGELDLSNDNHKKVLKFCQDHPKIDVNYLNDDPEFPEIRLGYDIVIESIQAYRKFLELLSGQDLPVVG
nr:hypothetical protein [uncultured Desulfobulbus sp.]